jgi:hypothetical protein
MDQTPFLIPASATHVLESVPGRLTSTKLKQMVEVKQDTRDYVQMYRPSLSLPRTRSNTRSYKVMLDTIYTLASDLKVNVADDVKYPRLFFSRRKVLSSSMQEGQVLEGQGPLRVPGCIVCFAAIVRVVKKIVTIVAIAE